MHWGRDRSSLGPGFGTSELTVYEGSVGLRWNLEDGATGLRPYVGAGGSLIWAELAGDSGTSRVTEDDTTLGTYLKAGILFGLPGFHHIGVEVRRLDAGVLTFTGGEANADSLEVLLIFGTGL